MKEEEYQADLQMKDHFDAGLEIKVLDLLLENAQLKDQVAGKNAVMIENAQLKNQAADTNAAVHDYLFKSEHSRTPATSDDLSSCRRDALMQNLENESILITSVSGHAVESVSRRRLGMPSLSKFVRGIRTRGNNWRSVDFTRKLPQRLRESNHEFSG